MNQSSNRPPASFACRRQTRILTMRLLHPVKSSTLVLFLLVIAIDARASSPSMTSVRPLGGRRGTEVDVTLGGGRLADAKQVLFYQPGIEMTKLEVVNDGQVKVKLKIAADCRLGLHDLRLRTATGLSE